ncbi:molybdopterin-synthase adenylyltransferase MoeB [Cellulomonas fengjieae]|uniref:Molybdopterin-synthase adenylyltransferase MoeB n=1 Tax=Cellulomonas fengjieae TaxID=2819978 RepID=A0ABS3SHU3_9CELL|nr:molybdopterin-synthase adenylyltransferase MoeB [Cellulomonas fengjieae]MBO3085323.1 molybdopterin-synthase adenylyltransferase MoeB [Cellulomonas fengjieae]MBO3101069.1 molybdopterin-synthase adenylyltransferase MoeB [Cellulomonas fengjieae]QVI66121.1 molybdopterin-synthase adenylyltransferase MoeB [Cellulomonas fengjieae]
MPLPALVPPGPSLTPEQVERGSRHLLLAELGVDGQRRLRNARVLVVGAGGLGAPVLQYLAAAGVGTLGIVDDDVVELSNLQRQVVHRSADVGRAKVDSAREAVEALDPDIRVVTHRTRLTGANVDDVLRGYDVVVDGTDNFPTRYLVNDACVRLGLPEVWGSVLRFDAQTTVFWGRAGVQLRDLFPTPPAPDQVPSCAEAGVLGALCGQIGSIMATEVVKLVTGTGEPLLGRVLVVDALRGRWTEVPLVGRPTPAPSLEAQPMPDVPVLTATELVRRLADREAGTDDFLLVDVREPAEHEQAAIPGAVLVPLGTVLDGSALTDLPRDAQIVVHCQVGGRSLTAARILRDAGFDAANVDGGIVAWMDAR